MSSTHSPAPPSQPVPSTSSNELLPGASSKKKFGKNLNKLIKQPAPPISGIGSGSGSGRGLSSSSLGSSRNSLLLLSTKKSSTGLLTSKPVSTAPKSAHDALLTAAAAAAGLVEPTKEPIQPAWGLVEKQQTLQHTQKSAATPPLQTLILAPKGGLSSGSHASASAASRQEREDCNDVLLNEIGEYSGQASGFTDGGTGWLENTEPVRIVVSSAETFDRRGTAIEGLDRKELKGSIFSSPESANIGSYSQLSIKEKTSDFGDRDEFAGRKAGSTSTESFLDQRKDGEGQMEYMARLARERAEKRRVEEEARMHEQKNRAYRRLQELESKMMTAPLPAAPVRHPISVDTEVSTSEKAGLRRPKQNTSEIVLELLGKGKGNGATDNTVSVTGSLRGPVNGLRTLYDPTRPYSSLLGGSTTVHERDLIVADVTSKKQGPFSAQPVETKASETELMNFPTQDSHKTLSQPPTAPLIHLASYEDRDRGERNSSAGPRMLFDPKSGSMVAVPNRDNGSAVKGKNDRNKTKSRNSRDRDDAVPAPLSRTRSETAVPANACNRRKSKSNEVCVFDESGDMQLLKVRSSQKEEMSVLKKDRKRTERESKAIDSNKSVCTDTNNINDNKGRKNGNKAVNPNPEAALDRPLRIPRTCGALYKRDDSGNFCCADGCEADHGYGAHSVPGGRIRNPKAYMGYLEQQKQIEAEAMQLTEKGGWLDQQVVAEGYYHNNMQQQYASDRDCNSQPQNCRQLQYFSDYDTTADENAMFSVNVSPRRPSKSFTKASEVVEDRDFDVPAPMRVRPNEKIELLTGAEESPTLQATAAAWAPSQAALAAAAIVAAAKPLSSDESMESESYGTDDSEQHRLLLNLNLDDDDTYADNEDDDSLESPSFLGLGFDPAENTDAVIMSPELDGASNDRSDPLNLSELPPQTSAPLKSSSRQGANSFGALRSSSQFLSSSTWGTGGSKIMSMGGLSNWDYLGGSANIDSSSSQAIGSEQQAVSFLSLSPLGNNENTWGSRGYVSELAGLGENSFGVARSNNSSGNDVD